MRVIGVMVELVDTTDSKSVAFGRGSSSLPNPTTLYAEIAQLVEHHVANVKVAGSIPAFRSMSGCSAVW